MIEQQLSGASGPRDGRTDPQDGTREQESIGWIGHSEDSAGVRQPGPIHVIGSAHGPRILELLRAS